jgi:hypothetical protein
LMDEEQKSLNIFGTMQGCWTNLTEVCMIIL